jgi:hypothetical protein
MYRSLIPATVLLLSSLGLSGEALASCQASDSTYLQCTFSVPEMSDGESSVFINTNTDDFSGATAVSCKAGTLVHSQQACAPANESDCAINTSAWYGSDSNRCEHEQQGAVLKNGTTKTISSTINSGSITYSCKNGSLGVDESSCGLVKTEGASVEINTTASSTATTHTEVAYIRTSFTRDTKITDTSSSVLRAEAEIACGNLAGSDISVPNPDIEYVGVLGTGNFQYVVQCPFTVSGLECDEFLLTETTVGTFSSSTGEMSNPPLASSYDQLCATNGGTGADEIVYSDNFNPGNNITAIDLFEFIAVCSGSQSSCGTVYSSNPLPELGSPIDCDSANVSTAEEGYIAVTGGASVTSTQVLEGLCEPMGFDTLESFNSELSTEVTSSGDVAYYSVDAVCSTYTLGDTAPLTSSCETGDVSDDSDVSVLTCDTASVEGNFRDAILNSQGDGIVESRLCNRNDYDTLDSWQRTGSVDSSTSVVTALCSGYSGVDVIDGCGNDECIGEVVDADSLYSTIEIGGVTYRDLCAEATVMDCASCSEGNFSFTDSVTGNTCTIAIDEAFSGSEHHYSFENSTVNGEVDVLCNNGGTSLVSGGDSVCYKSCPGNVTVGWDDSYGDTSCANTVPTGVYAHGDTVTIGSSLTNTGSASLECNGVTGSWEVKSGSCLLDCNETALWGSGTSSSGVSKNNLCQAPTGNVPHGSTGTLSSTTSKTSGTAKYSCSNGNLTTSNESCNLDCSTESVNWGTYCGTTISAVDHGTFKTVSHTKSTSYLYDSSISGSAGYTCDDGEYSESFSDCLYITGTSNGTWTTWAETGRSCTISPDSDDYEPGDYFVQTTTCNVDFGRSRIKYYVWSDGSLTQYDTENDEKTEVETSQQSVQGTGAPQRDFLGDVWDEWGDWSLYNNICFTTTCTEYYERYRYEYATYDMAPLKVATGNSERDTKTESVAAPREQTGTTWEEWSDWVQVGLPDCTTSKGVTTCETDYERERCQIKLYNIAPTSVTDCSVQEYETDTVTTTTGTSTPEPVTDLEWVFKTWAGCIETTNVIAAGKAYDETFLYSGIVGTNSRIGTCSNLGDTAMVVLGACSFPPTTGRVMIGAAICEDYLESIGGDVSSPDN